MINNQKATVIPSKILIGGITSDHKPDHYKENFPAASLGVNGQILLKPNEQNMYQFLLTLIKELRSNPACPNRSAKDLERALLYEIDDFESEKEKKLARDITLRIPFGKLCYPD